MTPENIKTRINLYWAGQEKPFVHFEEYNAFKAGLASNVSDNNPYAIPISFINVEGTRHEIKSVSLELRKETEHLHMTYGLSMSLQGESLPYNLDVNIYLIM